MTKANSQAATSAPERKQEIARRRQRAKALRDKNEQTKRKR